MRVYTVQMASTQKSKQFPLQTWQRKVAYKLILIFFIGYAFTPLPMNEGL